MTIETPRENRDRIWSMFAAPDLQAELDEALALVQHWPVQR